MTSGRMKGQAFIGLPREEAAVSAVGETNGHILHGKPMVVVSSNISNYVILRYISLTEFCSIF